MLPKAEAAMSHEKIMLLMFGGFVIAAWVVALWRRWPEAVFVRAPNGMIWYWLAFFGIPKTRENCVRFARGCCIAGIVLVSISTLLVLFFA